MAFTSSLRTSGLNNKSSSPFLKSTTPRSRSPTRNEQNLVLRRVIGTTTSSNNGFDSVESSSCFATIAGSGAVLATLGRDGQVTQRFFHAKPSSAPLVNTPSIYDSPTPAGSQQGARSRAAASLRESGFGAFPPASPSGDAFDSPNAKAAANRTKAATCVALSPDGKLLALGETGHKPRVLIFSTLKDAASDVAQNALSEHTFGVRCLAFSPDSQFLASLGDMNDGFLYIWSLNQRLGTATLHASNKCTSSIRQIAWMGGSLITVGTRHVKIWRIDEPSKPSPSKRMSDASFTLTSPGSKTLLGRNCLLGPLLDKTFTSIVSVTQTQAIVCSDTGDVCLLDDRDVTTSFTKITETSFPVNALAVETPGRVLVAGSDGRLNLLDLNPKSDSLISGEPPTVSEVVVQNDGNLTSPIVALQYLDQKLLLVDATRSLKVLDTVARQHSQLTLSLSQSFPAHRGSVLGLHSFREPVFKGAFITWSAEGTVLFWSADGQCTKTVTVPLEQLNKQAIEYTNELKVVAALGKGEYLVSGDRFGVLRVLDIASNTTVYENKAHGNEVTDIAVHKHKDTVLVATASRDRTVQLFQWHHRRFEHLQTIEEHTGAVTNLLFAADGRRLVSCSSDRTIMILDAVVDQQSGRGNVAGFLASRFITLKASPVSIDLIADQKDAILVSTIDRQIQKYDLSSGSLLTSFKTSDTDGSDAVILSSAIHVPLTKRTSVVAGVSSTDKSIRIYDESGRLLDKEYGHTEGMTGIGLVLSGDSDAGKTVVTVASDGTIFVWDLLNASQQMQEMFATIGVSEEAGQSPRFLATRPPLRKVLSSSELTRLHGLREEPEGGGSEAGSGSTMPARPALRRKTSKLSMVQTPRLDPPAYNSGRRSTTQSPSTAALESLSKRRASTTAARATSPISPNGKSHDGLRTSRAPTTGQPKSKRRSLSARPATTMAIARNALTSETEGICRSLHLYRKKLSTSSDMLALDSVRELERELSLTAKALAEKSARNETVMAKLLDEYSERLVGLLDEKIEATVARQMRTRRESNDSDAQRSE